MRCAPSGRPLGLFSVNALLFLSFFYIITKIFLKVKLGTLYLSRWHMPTVTERAPERGRVFREV